MATLLATWIALALTAGSTVAAPASSRKPAASRPSAAQPDSVLRISTSGDGVQFTDTGNVLVTKAGRPDLVRLPNNELLAIFEQAGDNLATPILAVSRSKDDGKTWLPAQPARLNGLPTDAAISSPSLLVMPTGLVRLYFAVAEKPARAKARGGTTICSAVTRDGVEYQVDRQVRIPCADLENPRLSAIRADKQIVLLVTSEAGGGQKKSRDASAVQQYTSGDGRTFSAPERARFNGEIGHAVQLDQHHWRMFMTSDANIYSRMSNDGIRWRNESGVCLRGGADPAVAQIEKNKYIMVFASASTPETAKAVPLAGSQSPSRLASKGDGVANPQSGENQRGEPQSGENTGTTTSAGAGWESFASGGFESELGADWAGSSGGLTESSQAGGTEDFAPVPDLRNKVDYLDWFARHIVPDDQNAYYSYVPVLEGIPAREEKINDMFNDPVEGQIPGPWKPADHPVWEESYQATQDLMAQYFQAARDPRAYSCPLRFGDTNGPAHQLLMNIDLSPLRDMRAAFKATMAQAWRAPDGTVPPEQMRTALETTFYNSRHLCEGPTIIEKLVGQAAQNLAHANAFQALHQGVFPSAEELQATLDMLQQADAADPAPGRWVRVEHAAAMDAIQYLFEPSTPGGQPQLRLDRLSQMDPNYLGGPSDDDWAAKLGQVTAADVRTDIALIDEHFRKMDEFFRTQFPFESADHFETEAIQIGENHPVARMILPSVARGSELMRRTETSRRAMQLACSAELFKARNGRYPSSLSELPADQIQDVRTDPYSGQDFRYRLTETGPRIYTVNRNGQDDGGEHSKKWADAKQEGEPDDYVFYPPQE